MFKRLCRAAIVVLALAAVHNVVYAQVGLPAPPDSLWVTIQDTIRMCRIVGGDTLPASMISPGYRYQMVYPPYSSTYYAVSECKHNGEVLKLATWVHNRRVHAPAELLTFNSRTEYFPVVAGDTISFYRGLRWIDPSNNRQDTTNYYSLDTLDMVMHLVRVSDGMPIQLDSLTVLPQVPAGRPVIYGERPIMALVRYRVPSIFDGDSVFIGITVRARGQGAYHWIRRDVITTGASAKLTSAGVVAYLNLYDRMRYGGAFERRNVEDLTRAVNQGGHIQVVPVDSRSVRISVALSDMPGAQAVIYDAVGRLAARGDGSEFVFTAPAAGTYYAAIVANGVISSATTIIIKE